MNRKHLLLLAVVILILGISAYCLTVKPKKALSSLNYKIIYETPQVMGFSEQTFYLSPNGEWVLFISSISSENGADFKLLNTVEQNIITVPPLNKNIQEQYQHYLPLAISAIWSEDSRYVYILGDNNSTWAINASSAPSLKFHEEPVSQSNQLVPPITFVQVSDKKINVVDSDDPEKIYMKHRGKLLSLSNIGGGNAVLSPNQRWASYLIGSRFGSFAGNSKAYLLDLKQPHTVYFLSDNILGPISFANNNKLFGLIRTASGFFEFVSWDLENIK